MDYRSVHRVALVAVTRGDLDPVLRELETTEDPVWLSKTQRLDRYTIRGVPGRRIDVAVDPRVMAGEALTARPATDEHPRNMSDLLAAEVGRKIGKFDGAERWRITIRVWDGRTFPHPLAGRLAVLADTCQLALRLFDVADRLLWSWTGERLRSAPQMDGYRLQSIVFWHLRRYYGFLLDESRLATSDVQALADGWAAGDAQGILARGGSLAELNRSASRALYRLAVDCGWRKLTLREREAIGWGDRPQWLREEVVAERRAALRGYDARGVSEDSQHAARTGRWHSDTVIPAPIGMAIPEDET